MSEFGSLSSLSTFRDDDDVENARLRMEIALLRAENVDRKSVKPEDQTFKSALHGAWKPVSSINTDKFLERAGASELSNVIFQLAQVHLDMNSLDGHVMMYEKVGSKRYHEKSFELSKPQIFGRVSCLTYISDNVMKTIYLDKYQDGQGEQESEERFLKDGRLHIIINRFGVKCTRIYEKVGASSIISKDPQIQSLRKKIENLQAENAKLKLALEKEKNKKSLSSSSNPKPKGAPNAPKITKSICGLWQRTGATSFTSIKIDGGRYMVRTLPDPEYSIFQLNGKTRGWTVNVVDNRLVLRRIDESTRCETGRQEMWVESDGKLVDVCTFKNSNQRYVYEKVGEPL